MINPFHLKKRTGAGDNLRQEYFKKTETNMKPTFCFILLTSFIIAVQTSALAVTSDTIRCGDNLVSVGDVVSDVVGKCGQPTFAAQREEKIVGDGVIPGERIITTIVIDDWTFNFGPDRFQYRILLKNGRVWQIESLGYGY